MNKLLQLIIISIFFLSISQSVKAQGLLEEEDWYQLPEGLGVSNHLEYSYNIDDKIEILENWLDVDYNRNIFSAGFRFEVFQPNDPDPSISRGKNRFAEINFKYVSLDIGDYDEGLEVTVGNYYTLFGRGLILKSYEDRNIRIDNNLLGIKITGRYSDLVITGLSGMPENAMAERNDILHALDMEYRGLDIVKFGGTFASNKPDIDNAARTSLASFRLQPSFDFLDIYTEYGTKMNEDIEEELSGDDLRVGEAFYGNLNLYFGSFSFTGEVKHYDNYSFTSNDGTVFYNTPPSLRKEYTYQLLNRHPSPLDQSNERGFQVEANYSISYDADISANFSITETLSPSSFYQRVNDLNNPVQTQFKEFYTQGQYRWSDALTTIGAFGYIEELQTNTISYTPIIENRFYFGDVNTIKVTLEHQQVENRTTDEFYYDDLIAIEYLRSPKLSISFVAEVETKEPTEGKTVRRLWSFIQFGYKFGNHTDISLLVGSRQAGNICIGGVCRFEPAFQGVELKMFTRF